MIADIAAGCAAYAERSCDDASAADAACVAW